MALPVTERRGVILEMLFKDRVLKILKSHTEIIEQPKGSTINFLSCHHGHWKAFFVKAHGRITKSMLEDLQDYQRNTGISVYLVSEQADHVPRFEVLNRYLRWREQIKARYERINKKEGEK